MWFKSSDTNDEEWFKLGPCDNPGYNICPKFDHGLLWLVYEFLVISSDLLINIPEGFLTSHDATLLIVNWTIQWN